MSSNPLEIPVVVKTIVRYLCFSQEDDLCVPQSSNESEDILEGHDIDVWRLSCVSSSMRVLVAQSLHIHDIVTHCYGRLLRLLLVQNPDCVKFAPNGWIPLHTACRFCGGRLDMLRDLVEVCPESVRVFTTKGSLPLHLLTTYGGEHTESVEFIMKEFPAAVKIRAGKHNVSIESAETEEHGWLPFHYLIRFFGDALKSIEYVFQEYKFAMLKTCNRWTPLQLAVRYFPNNFNLINFLITVFPGSILDTLHDVYSLVELWEYGGGTDQSVLQLLHDAYDWCSMSNEEMTAAVKAVEEPFHYEPLFISAIVDSPILSIPIDSPTELYQCEIVSNTNETGTNSTSTHIKEKKGLFYSDTDGKQRMKRSDEHSSARSHLFSARAPHSPGIKSRKSKNKTTTTTLACCEEQKKNRSMSNLSVYSWLTKMKRSGKKNKQTSFTSATSGSKFFGFKNRLKKNSVACDPQSEY